MARKTRFHHLHLLVLLAGDALLAGLVWTWAYTLRLDLLGWLAARVKPTDPADYEAVLVFVIAIKVLCLKVVGLYDTRLAASRLETFLGVVKFSFLSTAVTLAALFWNKAEDFSRLVILLDLGLTFALFGLWRLGAATCHLALRRSGYDLSAVLFVGSAPPAPRIAEKMAGNPKLGYRPVGFLDDHLPPGSPVGPSEVVGRTGNLVDAARRLKADEIFLASPEGNGEVPLAGIAQCEQMGLEVKVVPTFYSVLAGNTTATEVDGVPILGVRRRMILGTNRVLKEVEDFLLSAILAIVTLPVAVLAALAIKLDSKGPILFRQDRVGRFGRLFTMYKFRTMFDGAEQDQERLDDHNEKEGAIFKIADDPRVTRVGRLLRRTSLDELPQLLNVLRGDMSLVGPRPLPAYEVDEEDPWHQARMTVLPGITGMWQVNGRSDTTFQEMVKWDLYYTRNWSLWLDLKILIKTMPEVLRARGAY